MNKIIKAFNSSIGRKTIMALTGLFLCIFLIEHLYTNLLLYKDDAGAAFIEASHSMVHNLLIRIIEIILFLAIIVHVLQALNLTMQNNKARPIKYAVNKVNQTSSWFSRNMGLTGSIIFFFLIIHLNTFFVSYRITGLEEGQNIAWKVKDAFSHAWYAGLYTIAMLFLGFHLNHGFHSAFQSLGLNNKKYMPLLKMLATVFALIMTLGFISFPILFYFGLAGKTF